MRYFNKHTVTVCISILMFSNLSAGQGTASTVRTGNGDEKRLINVEDMFSLRDLGGMGDEGLSVSPDGKYVAFQIHSANLEENSYEVDWYVLGLTRKGESPVRIGDAGNPLLFRFTMGRNINGAWQSTNPVWSPDSHWAAYRRMGDETVQVWRSSPDGRIQEQLTDSEASVIGFSWSEDSSEIWFETDATAKERSEYLDAKWEGGLWADDEGFRSHFNSTYPVLPFETNAGQPKLWIQDLRSGKMRAANAEEVEAYFATRVTEIAGPGSRIRRNTRVPGRPNSKDVTKAYNGVSRGWLEDDPVKVRFDRIHVRLGSADQSDFACDLKECSGHITGLWWSRDDREVIFGRLDFEKFGRTVFYAWDIEKNTVRKIHTESNRHLSACSSTGTSLICFSDDAEHPRVLVEVQFADGSLTELYDPNPQFEQILVGETELIEWLDVQDNESHGWLVKPIGYEKGKRYPLVIVQYNHRSCFKGGTGAEYPAHLFAAEGFAVLCMTHPAPVPNENGAPSLYWDRSHVLSSWEAAIDTLDEQGLIDPARVGLTGLSAGVDAMAYGLHRTDRFSAAIAAWLNWSPDNQIHVNSARRKRLNEIFGFGSAGVKWGDDNNVFAEMSLGLNADKLTTPILVQVSDNEAQQSRFNYAYLQDAGKPVDKYVFRDEYHIKWWPQNRRAAAVRSVDWMRFWLKDEEDSDPAKAEQYERWRAMREARMEESRALVE